MPTEPCQCGSPLPTVEVRGRSDDVLHFRARDGGTVTLLPLALSTVLENAGIFHFQLRQTGEHTLQVRLGPGQETSIAACRRALNSFAKAQQLAPLELDIRTGQAVVHGRSGKLRRIIGLRA